MSFVNILGASFEVILGQNWHTVMNILSSCEASAFRKEGIWDVLTVDAVYLN